MNLPSKAGAQAPQSSAATSVRHVFSLRRCAWLVLVVGWLLAALIYVSAAPEADAGAAGYMTNERVYDYNVERIGGKAALFATHFNEWLGSLWHGRRLALTVAVLSLLATLLCWWIGGLLAEQAADRDEGADRQD